MTSLRTGTLLVAVVLTATCGFAQSKVPARIQSRIRGTVTDLDGRPLIGVSIVIKNSQTEALVVVMTDEAGRFSVDRLRGSRYLVTVEPILTPGPNGVRVILDSDEPNSAPKRSN